MQNSCYQPHYTDGMYSTLTDYGCPDAQTTLTDFDGTFPVMCSDSGHGFSEQTTFQPTHEGLCDSQATLLSLPNSILRDASGHQSLPNSSTSYYKVQMALSRKPQVPEQDMDRPDIAAQTDDTHDLAQQATIVTSVCSDVYSLDAVHKSLTDNQEDYRLPQDDNSMTQSDEHTVIVADSSPLDQPTEIKEEQTQQTSGEKTQTDIKPPLSYIALIGKAILESTQQRLSLGSIYNWIEKNYPFYKNRSQGWRNSVRHNLSLNDCFIKAGRCEDGKGNYWSIHPANLQDFMRGDFRQRRRSRRRGRKRDCDYGAYGSAYAPAPNGYYGNAQHAQHAPPVSPTYHAAPPPALTSIYSPYSEAERRAYRLDEVLLKQTMNNPFFKWYNNGSCTPPGGNDIYSPNQTAPPNYDMYNNSYSTNCNQWQPAYTDYANSHGGVYPFSSSYPRYVK